MIEQTSGDPVYIQGFKYPAGPHKGDKIDVMTDGSEFAKSIRALAAIFCHKPIPASDSEAPVQPITSRDVIAFLNEIDSKADNDGHHEVKDIKEYCKSFYERGYTFKVGCDQVNMLEALGAKCEGGELVAPAIYSDEVDSIIYKYRISLNNYYSSLISIMSVAPIFINMQKMDKDGVWQGIPETTFEQVESVDGTTKIVQRNGVLDGYETIRNLEVLRNNNLSDLNVTAPWPTIAPKEDKNKDTPSAKPKRIDRV